MKAPPLSSFKTLVAVAQLHVLEGPRSSPPDVFLIAPTDGGRLAPLYVRVPRGRGGGVS